MVEVDWTPNRIRALREALKLSRPEFGAALKYSRRTILNWETGRNEPRADGLRALDAALSAADVVVQARFERAITPADHPTELTRGGRQEDNAMRRRHFLTAVTTAIIGVPDDLAAWPMDLPRPLAPIPRRIGTADVVRVRITTESLRRTSNRSGGCASLDAARGALAWNSHVIDRAQATDRVREQYALAVADLANVTGWAMHDAGLQDHAQDAFARGLTYTTPLACPAAHSLTASLMYGLGRVSLHLKIPEDALHVVALGQQAAQTGRDRGSAARLHATAAWAYALMGQPAQVQDSLDRALHEMSHVEPASIEPWHQVFFTPGDFTGHQALLANVLAATAADPRQGERFAVRAATLATTSLTESGTDRPPRSLLFDRIVLATSSFRAGDIPGALTAARRAISDLHTIHSARARDRVTEIAAAAAPYRRTRSEVDQLVTEIDDLTPA